MTIVRPKMCVLCQAQESREFNSSQSEKMILIRIDVKVGEREVYLCDACVRNVINTDRRRKYAEKHYLKKHLKMLDRFENKPSKRRYNIMKQTSVNT